MASRGVKSGRQPSENHVNISVKLRHWEDDFMTRAMDAVFTGSTMGINCAALEYGVPPTTLKDQVAGRVVHCTKMGAKPYFTYQEEQELVSFLLIVQKWDMEKLGKMF